MKKIYTTLCLTMLLSLFVGQNAMATSPWKANSNANRISEVETTAEESENIYIGHCSSNDEIWPSDGVSLDHDARVGIGVKLTRELYKDFIGTKIVGMRAGWDDEGSDALFECFVRTGNFTGPDLVSGKGMASFGWNDIMFKNPVEMPNTNELYIGFYTELKKNVCSIPFLYPYINYDRSNCAYSHIEGDTEPNGKEKWINMSNMWQPVAVMLIIADEEGKFKNLIVFGNVISEVIVTKSELVPGIFDITNKGTNKIESLEITTTLGEETNSMEVALSNPISRDSRSHFNLPIYCFGSGEHTITITKVNGEPAKDLYEHKVSLIGIPTEVSEKYTHRPVVEFYSSENAYQHPVYFDEYFYPQVELFKGEMTVLCQHVDDQFQTGKNEALTALIELCAMDSMKVMIPSSTINRSYYSACIAPVLGTPFQNGIILPEYNVPLYEDVVAKPTFANININGEFDKETSQANITVYGHIEEGILPENEEMFLTVYLMEKDVESWDQMFWEDKPGEVPEPKLYVHKNVIREIITDFWGDSLKQSGGDYEQKYTIDIDLEEYKGENLYIMAHLNRGPQNNNLNRNIINSAEMDLGIESSVDNIINDSQYIIRLEGGKILVDNQVATVYNLAGSQVLNENVAPGIYIVKAIVDGNVIARKYVVR